METLKNNWDFFLEHMSKDEFLKAVNKALGERKERDNACFRLESLLFIADYYQIQGKKWYLNTLETEFYRPVVPPKK
jgi:20S proteasome alpha/beta subunit